MRRERGNRKMKKILDILEIVVYSVVAATVIYGTLVLLAVINMN